MLQKNEIYTVTIDGYTAEGAGVARIDGQAVFVPETIVGEEAEIKINHVGKRFAYGTLLQLKTVSPHRVNRDCPIGKRCGGCDFWHMSYEEELRLKASRVKETLNRVGGQSLAKLPITGADSTEGYRNKVIFPVAKGKQGAEAGFYQKGTHDIIATERCLIQPEITDKVKAIVVRWMHRWTVPAYNEKNHTGCVRHIFVRTSKSTGDVMVCIITLNDQFPKAQDLVERLQADIPGFRTLIQAIQPKKTNVVLGETLEIIHGDGIIEETLCGNTFQISAKSFFQINRDQAEKLYEKALEYAALTKEETALDLYCGAGTITLTLAKTAKNVIGVEIVEQAVLDARHNQEINNIENVSFHCADAGTIAKQLAQVGTKPNVIVVDPPRKGLSQDVIDAIVSMSPERLVYVSCDPATLSRDVALLSKEGYSLKKARAFDLFPRCAHVETVCLLTK